ncbi:MAG: glycosyltransferase [Anaerolineae bacterium]|nr:glycosyltransferase [Anaerolineae bacterium]
MNISVDRPRILFFSHVLPYPLDSGPKVRTYYVLKYLVQRYDITLVCIIRSEKERHFVSPLEEMGVEVHPVLVPRSYLHDALSLLRSLGSKRPFMIVRHHYPEVARVVAHLLAERRFDALHVDQVKMAQYGEGVLDLPRVVDKHNAYALILKGVAEADPSPLKRWVARLDWQRMARYEGQICRSFDQVVAVTEEDRRALEEFADRPLPIQVIPIAADADMPPLRRALDACDILSVGSMFYPPNVEGALWFARRVFPRIKARSPETRLFLVGSRPAASIIALGRQDPQIVVTGYVEDLQPYLERAAVMIVPLRFGSGMRVKVLDALARGVPLVSTTFGCEGITVIHGQDVLLADEPEDFADAVLRLIQDRAFADTLAANGRELIRRVYDWRVVYRRWDQVYDNLLGE